LSTARSGHAGAIVATVIGNELRLMTADIAPLVAVVLGPLALVGFSASVYERTSSMGHGHSGASFALPGQTVLFALLLVTFGGFSFYREHGWNTWNRLRISSASTPLIVIGKLTPWLVVAVIQGVLLAIVGWLVLGFDINGDAAAYVIALVFLAAVIVAAIFAAYAWLPTVYHLNALGNLGAIVLGGIGGAFAAVSSLPGWVQLLAKATPSYWAITALRDVSIDGAGVGDVVPNILALAAIAAATTLAGLARFRASAPRRSFAN
jgi:ABC-2 type transport system permease protein